MTSMPTRNTTETSVALSLADLTKIEEERLRHEQAERDLARQRKARAEREAAEQERARIAAESAAQAEARARAARDAVLDQAQIEARERAAIEVARFEAEARARLEADNAARAHELMTLRVKRETGRRRREVVLGAALAIFLLGGGVAAHESSNHAAALERETVELHEAERALARERDDAKKTELEVLDRRHAALTARAAAKDAGEARATADSARHAIDERSLDHGRLRAFAEALDALQDRLENSEKFGALQRRHADLAAWAAAIRRTDATASARSAALAVKAPGAGQDALEKYERALDELAATLAKPAGGKGFSRGSDSKPPAGTCLSGDPGCGIDGRPLF